MIGRLLMTKLFSLSFLLQLLAILIVTQGNAVAAKLEAVLCTEADLVTGQFQKIENLRAGGNGFMLAVTSSYEDSVLVNLRWERLPDANSGNNQRLASDMLALSTNQTKFVPFKAPEGGLMQGRYQVVLTVAGQEDETLNFIVTPAVAAAGPNAVQSNNAESTSGDETVSEALTRVFATTEGPESAKAGIEVIGTFFDKELNPSTTDPTAAAKETATNNQDPVASQNNSPQTTFPEPAATSYESNQSKPASDASPPSTANSDNPLPSSEAQVIRAGGIEIVCARQVDSSKTPTETPAIFQSNDAKIYLAMRSTDPNLKDLVAVQWFAKQVEGLPAGVKLADSKEVLRVGNWNTAVFPPPYGGFFPGTYRVTVAKDRKPLAETEFSIQSPEETALLLEEMAPPQGINIALAGLGGTVISATSESNSSTWAKQGLIDGFGFGGEDCKPSCGWASSDRSFPQELVFSFSHERKAQLEGVIVDGGSCPGDEKCLQSLPRLVEVWVSTTAADAGYTKVATRRLRPVADKHFIPLQTVHAKYLKLVIASNYGGTRRTQLAEVEILEKPGPDSIVKDGPIDLAIPAFGGSVLRYTSESHGGEAVRLLKEHPDGKGWRSEDQNLPQEFTFCLRDDGEALIDRVELKLDSGYDDPTSRPKEVAVLVSSASPTEGFVETARVELPMDGEASAIPVNHRARFIKLRILENHGGKNTSLGKISIFEGQEAGYTSLLQRAVTPLTSATWAPPELDPSLVTSSVQPALSPEEPPLLELGKQVKATFDEYDQVHYYSLQLQGDQPGMLNLELMGLPFLRTKLTLKNTNGDTVAVFQPRRNASHQTIVSWFVEPGQYLLEAESTPANLVLAWDVSGSMATHADLLQQAVIGFLENVQPSEKLSLIAFNNNIHVLTKGFTSDKSQLLAAVSGRFKTEMATRLYDAIEKGIKLLGDTEGVGAMVVMTDGADMGSILTPPQFWDVLDKNSVRMFTVGLGGELKVNNPETGMSGAHLLRHIAEAAGGRFIFIPNAEQLVDAYQQIARELMAGTTYYLKPTWTIEPGSLIVKTEGERIAQVATPPSIELVLDGSGSMKEKLGDKTRMAVAKDVLSELVQGLPADVEIALRVYGHRVREGKKGDCQDTELIYPFGRLDKARLISQIQAVKPLGTTPIAYSLLQTAKDFGEKKGEKTIILVTDGKEECGGDLVKTVEDLQAQGLDVRLHVVGFTVKDPTTQAEMQKVAEAGGGRYLSAADRQGLEKAIAQTLAIPFTVRDSGGREIARGVAGEELRLPAGYYKIVMNTPKGELIEEAVLVDQGKITQLRVTKDGPKIGVQVLPPVENR
ncbi:VWA domain-containing protein [Desulfopila aestuarii]|uniref:Mg-chelatase subunit ChlD n=1 Tax=Desulfopila aestuarii DSM 18488 TaxID=1121416 RepID=A0A1M7Y543_9BACT|nr:VWA domain-containing protein [Desulfopila aestuarii]SHO47347.1 Mg-chelatase subunit ChlD [Desulfopila aestuarii DSM 18488]